MKKQFGRGRSDKGKSGDKPFKGRGKGQEAGDKGRKFGERKSGDRPYKKSFGDKPFEKKSFDDRKSGDRPYKKSFGDKPFEKKSFGGDRERSRDDKPFRKNFGDKPFEKKSFGERKSGDRPYRGDKGQGTGDKRRSFGDKPFEKKSFGERKSGDRPYKKNFGSKDFSRREKPFVKRDEEKDSSDWTVFENADEAKDFIKANRNEKKTSGRSSEYAQREFSNENRPLKLKRSSGDESDGIRLNRFIANTGICSRREADDLIEAGVIKVNGKIVTELGTKISPSDTIHYGDQLLRRENMVYVLLNKPKDYITTTDDPRERKTVMHLVESACRERIYPVGRLDRNTTGLLLFTNDGDLAERLTHPKYGIRKIYHVSLDKNLRAEDFDKILAGVEMEDGYMKADELSFVGDGTDKKEVGIVIHSGRNRIVRRLFETLGYDVVHLDRVVYAGLTKKNLPRSRFRHLTTEEVGMLRMQVGGDKKIDSKRFEKSRSKGKRK